MSAPTMVRDRWESVPARRLLVRQSRPVPDWAETVTAFRDGEVVARSKRRVEGFTESTMDSDYQGVEVGDLVVHSMDGFAGAIGVSRSDGKMSPVVHIYRSNGLLDLRFAQYFLRHLASTGYVQALAKGIRERSTSFDPATLADLPIPVPPIEEQRRIADFLDDQVTRIQRTCDLRSQQMEAIRLAFNARVAHDLIESSRGCAAPLRRFLAGVRTGSTPPEDWVAEESGVPWYTPASISPAGSLGLPVRLLPDGATRRDGVVHFKPRSVLLVGIGATAGRVALLDHPGAGNQQLTALEVNDRLDWIFLYFQLKVRSEQLLESAPFTTLPIINNDTIRTFSIVAPPMRDQLTLVGDWLSAESRAESTLMQMRQVVARLNEYKSSLITAAVTGELDVTTARRGVPA